MFTSPSFSLSSSVFQCTEGNQKGDAFAPKTSTWASPLSSTTTFGAPSFAGFGSSMSALGFSSVHPFGSSQSTSVQGPHATSSISNFKQSHCGGQERGSRIENYKRTPGEIEFGEYVSISAMPIYKDKSHEELRWEDYKFTTKEPHAPRSTVNFEQSHCGGEERGSRIENYKRTPAEIEFGEYVSISAMPVYKGKSHEELRWEDYKVTTKEWVSIIATGSHSSSGIYGCPEVLGQGYHKGDPFALKTSSIETVYGSPTTSNYGAQTSSPLVEGPHASRSTVNFKQSHCGGERGSRIENYKRTPAEIEFGEYVSISAMPVYKDKSHEELRWEDYQFTPKGGFGSSSSASPCSITAIANLTAALNKFNSFVPKTTLPSLPTHTSSSSPSFEKCTGTPLPPKSHLSLEGSPSVQYGISNIPEIHVAAFVPRELAITGTMHEEKLPGSVYENDKDDPTEEKNLLPTILDAPSKLQLPDYYTIPHISELESKERAEPGFCSHVKEFVIGRHGYGSIKFLGETDIRNLDLETFVQFNNRELIVYMDETKKPPVGQGLNKPAEITLLNIKCIDKRSGVRYEEGPMIDKYREMLKKKVAAQGGEFISYHPVEGEWKFRVQHF